jgi:HAD superfamily hydrolase (TIGR01509 family)
MNNKKAIIFDMDGVISDTQKFHAEVESLLLKTFDIDMKPEEITKIYAGVADEKMFAQIFKNHGIKVDSVEKIVFKKWDLMRKVAHGKITEIPHAVELIQTLKKNGFKLAIASASTKAFINEVLLSLNISKYFDTIVSAQEVQNGKPSPDIFLLAAQKLGIQPEEAVVIEDGKSGMIGATAANMKSIGLVTDVNADYPATQLVSSLDEITIELIHKL